RRRSGPTPRGGVRGGPRGAPRRRPERTSVGRGPVLPRGSYRSPFASRTGLRSAVIESTNGTCAFRHPARNGLLELPSLGVSNRRGPVRRPDVAKERSHGVVLVTSTVDEAIVRAHREEWA